MKRSLLLFAFAIFIVTENVKSAGYRSASDSFPVRAFAIEAPYPLGVDSFVRFIQEELAPRNINTLILRVDYHYQFTSHPELREDTSLSKKEVQKIVKACKKSGILIIPQINLLGHQSWANKTGKLLKVYPQFDETPGVIVPEIYQWPNSDKLYCKSYCPLHPDLHKVIFALIDEICDVFETDAFHAGMDEVFYIADDNCPRCSGHDPAALFAGEVMAIRNHLAEKNRQLWIWGDRLLDGKTTGLGEWEASMNNTYRAVDMIPKDVIICDWHYERPDQTAVYFAMKGFNVITCTFRNPQTALQQSHDVQRFRTQSTSLMKDRFLGVMQTVWSKNAHFLNEFYGTDTMAVEQKNTTTTTFKSLFPKL
jgi:hypothetical protein